MNNHDTALAARFAAFGIDAGFHPGVTGRGRVWLYAGGDIGPDGQRVFGTGHNIESDGRRTDGNRWCWRVADAEKLIELIEGSQ